MSHKAVSQFLLQFNGLKRIVVGALFGTLMISPAYRFFPFLKEFREKDTGENIIATTIGAWAIKVAWIPFAIIVFGRKFTLLFNALILVFAVLPGLFVGIFFKDPESH